MRLVIFDFDGTIADTRDLYYNAMIQELRILGYSKQQIGKALDVGLSLRKTLYRLGLSFLYVWWIDKRIKKRVMIGIEGVKKCKNVEKIAGIGGKKILVTNSERGFAMPILKHLKIKKYFREVFGAESFVDKSEFIKNYMRKRKITGKDCFYVGDRAADVKVARRAGCLSIIISSQCSWSSRKEILKADPDYLVDGLEDLGKIIK